MNILSILFFDILEKFQLRNWQGVGRAGNRSFPSRNEAFYQKLRENLNPVLEEHGFTEVRKRRFVKMDESKLYFIEFALTKRRNGIKNVYGTLTGFFPEDGKLKDFHSLTSYGQFEKDWFILKPAFWKYDYEYPVQKDEKNDAVMISEISELLQDQVLK